MREISGATIFGSDGATGVGSDGADFLVTLRALMGWTETGVLEAPEVLTGVPAGVDCESPRPERDRSAEVEEPFALICGFWSVPYC